MVFFFHETLIYLLIQHIKLFLFYLKRYDGILLYTNFRYIKAVLIKGICGYFNLRASSPSLTAFLSET